MTQLVQALVLGLLIGGVYALMASGLTLIFGVMNIINVAHGALLILVAFITWKVWSVTGVDPILLSFVMTPVMFGVGWLLYKGVLARISGGSPGMSVLLTFGIAITIEGILNVTAGNKFRSATPSYFSESYRVFGISLPKAQVYGCLAAVLVLGPAVRRAGPHVDRPRDPGDRRRTPRAPRSSASRPPGSPRSPSPSATATTGVGGSVLSVLYPFFPASHYDWISRLLGIIVLGGMGSLAGALVGALILGLAETLTATYISLQWSTLIFYAVIMVVLLFRPQGLFGSRLRQDVMA